MKVKYLIHLDDGRSLYQGKAWWLEDGSLRETKAHFLAKTAEEARGIWLAILAREFPSVERSQINYALCPLNMAIAEEVVA